MINSSAVKSLPPTPQNVDRMPQSAVLTPSPAFTPQMLPASLSASRAQPALQTPAQQVNTQFATRPTVRAVVAEVLEKAITQLSPHLQLDPAHTSVSRPGTDSPTQRPLLEVALESLSVGNEVDLNDAVFNPPLTDSDKHNVELTIRSLPELLKPAFQQALFRYWGQPGASPGERNNRQQGVSGTLKDMLRTAALTQPGLTDEQRQTLDQVVTFPDSTQRQSAKGENAAKVFVLDSTLQYQGGTTGFLSPDLLITRPIGERIQVLHVGSGGIITPYDSLEHFGKAWGERLQQTFVFDTLSWKRQETRGNVFDTQAALLLNRDLENVASIPIPGAGAFKDLDQLFSRASNPASWFNDAYTPRAESLEQITRKFPDWLHRASPQERFAYHASTLDLASSVQRNHGRTFLTDIPDIREFTRQHLQTHLQPLGLRADQMQVTFKVPVGTLGSGYIERVTMSLTDMALRNLAGLPKGAMEIHHNGQLLTDPSLPQTLKSIITQVDIGQTYPALLQRELLDDTPTGQGRRTLFAEQVPIQLAMQAMELKLKGQAGITDKGYQLLQTVLTPGPGEKKLDGQPVVVRPLAFLRKPGATPDVVSNMFLIEPKDSAKGPHLLYRPLLEPPLQEFASRQALLEALQKPGTLQKSVLAWLPDERTRAVYGNGGFKTPNIARYSVFNEFDAPSRPAPTALAVDGYAAQQTLARALQDGKLMSHLFETNAHSLVNLAQGQSVSDTQSRWASYKELGWLLLNTVLPVLRGPGAMAGWLLQLAGTEEDIKKLSNLNGEDASAATVDLLVNVAMLLTQYGMPHTPGPTKQLEHFEAIAQPDGPATREPNSAPPPPPIVRQSAQDGAPGVIGNDHSALDFAASTPEALTAQSRRALIDSFKVATPSGIGSPIAEGPKKGLYRIQDKLYAQIDNQWFRAAYDLDGVYIIDENNKARTAPPVTYDAQGHWRFGTRPGLRGGGRAKQLEERLDAAAREEQKVLAECTANIDANAKTISTFGTTKDRAVELVKQHTNAHNKLDDILKKLDELKTSENPGDRQSELAAEYKMQVTAAQESRIKLEQHVNELEQLADSASTLIQERIKLLTPQKRGALDDTPTYKNKRSDAYKQMFEMRRVIQHLHNQLVQSSSRYTSRGVPNPQLSAAVKLGRPGAYETYLDAAKITFEDRETQATAAEASQEVLDQWINDSPSDKKEADIYIKQNENFSSPGIFALKVKFNSLRPLRDLSMNRYASTTDSGELFFLTRFRGAELQEVASSFIKQQEYSGYPPAERKAALQTIINKYEQFLNDGTSLYEANPSLFRETYWHRLVKRLDEIISRAQSQMADALREEQAESPPAAAAQPEKPRRPKNMRVFKTRDNKTLIGTLRATQDANSPQILDVLDPDTNKPITSYGEHQADGEWVKIVPAPTVQSTSSTPSPKSLASYKSDGNSLIREGEAIERTILFQKKKLNDPQRLQSLNPLDWNDMLESPAKKLEQTAQRIEAEHGNDPKAIEQARAFKETAAQMLKKARQHCAEGYMALPPRPENIDFLWRHGFVDINLVRRDIPTQAGDVFTEYVVRKKGTNEALWFAHFHYPSKNAPYNLYTVAHLKIPSQCTKTQKGLIAEARLRNDNRAIEQIIRARIGKPLDEKLFLKL